MKSFVFGGAAGLLAILAMVRPTAASVITFDDLPLGPMTAGGSWYAVTDNGIITPGTGSDTSQVFMVSKANSVLQAYRNLDAAFGLPSPQAGDQAILGMDFHLGPYSDANSYCDFDIGPTTAITNDPKNSLGVGYLYNPGAGLDRVQVETGNGSGYAGGANNFTDTHGDWFRAQMLLDFTGTDVYASMSVEDLTAGGSLAPVSVLQNYDTHYLSSGVTPAWDIIYIDTENVQMDNLTLSIVPEPSSLVLLGIAGAALSLRRRKR